MHATKPEIGPFTSLGAEPQRQVGDEAKFRTRLYKRGKQAWESVRDTLSHLWSPATPKPLSPEQGLEAPSRTQTPRQTPRLSPMELEPAASLAGSESTSMSSIDWSRPESPMRLYGDSQQHAPSLLMQAVCYADLAKIDRVGSLAGAHAPWGVSGCAEALGATPLMAATLLQDATVVEEVLKLGPEVNTSHDVMRFTPLMYAVRSGEYDKVKMLLDAGADVNMRCAFGQTAVHMAKLSSSQTTRGHDILALLQARERR